VDADQLLTWVRQEFATVMGADVESIDADTHLADELDADSIDLIEVVNAAERKYGVVIEEQDLYDIKTIGQFAALIQRAAG
jgi:acyl carrier protein